MPIAAFLAILVATAVAPQPAPWRVLEPGLELLVWAPRGVTAAGDSTVHVLRIDPERFDLRLLNASAPDQGAAHSARDWSRLNGLVAATNAGMYQTDLRTSVALMRSDTHVNNPRLTRDKAVLAFAPRDTSLPPVQIIDRERQDFERLRRGYTTLVQGIRMVSLDGRNTWASQPRAWSTAAIAMDKAGRVLLIHVRAPYVTHELIEVLLSLPLDLKNAMYLEGGPEAQLYVHAGGVELERLGAYGSGFAVADENAAAWPVPNVIGVVRRKPTQR